MPQSNSMKIVPAYQTIRLNIGERQAVRENADCECGYSLHSYKQHFVDLLFLYIPQKVAFFWENI